MKYFYGTQIIIYSERDITKFRIQSFFSRVFRKFSCDCATMFVLRTFFMTFFSVTMSVRMQKRMKMKRSILFSQPWINILVRSFVDLCMFTFCICVNIYFDGLQSQRWVYHRNSKLCVRLFHVVIVQNQLYLSLCS